MGECIQVKCKCYNHFIAKDLDICNCCFCGGSCDQCPVTQKCALEISMSQTSTSLYVLMFLCHRDRYCHCIRCAGGRVRLPCGPPFAVVHRLHPVCPASESKSLGCLSYMPLESLPFARFSSSFSNCCLYHCNSCLLNCL